MAYEATPSQGTVFAIGAGDGASVAAASDTFTTISGIRDFSGPGGQATVIDATTLASTAKEKIMGLADEGQLTLNGIYSRGDAGQAACWAARAARTKKNIKVTFADTGGEVMDFKAFVLGFEVSGGVDDTVNVAITLEITGAITSTP